jgi:hypothetical protein
MSQAASFEAAQVRIVLNRNLAQIYEAMSTYPSLRPVDASLNSKLTFSNQRLPFRVLEFDAKKIHFFRRLRIEPPRQTTSGSSC